MSWFNDCPSKNVQDRLPASQWLQAQQACLPVHHSHTYWLVWLAFSPLPGLMLVGLANWLAPLPAFKWAAWAITAVGPIAILWQWIAS